MWPFNLPSSSLSLHKRGDIRRPHQAHRPCRARTALNLEILEERALLNGATVFASSATHDLASPSSSSGPILLRPAIESPPPASPPTLSFSPPSSILQAASTLFIDGIDLGIGKANQYFRIPEIYAFPAPVSDLNASIAFYSPYVGPWAPFFVLAGEIVGAAVQYQVQINSLQSF